MAPSRRFGPGRRVFELYSVATDASTAPVKLSEATLRGASMRDLRIAPAGDRVVYIADQDTDEVVELYSVRLDGSAGPVKLSGNPVSGGDVGNAVPRPLHAPLGASADVVADVPGNLTITPDSRHVLYNADAETDEVLEVFESPLPSGTPGRVRPK